MKFQTIIAKLQKTYGEIEQPVTHEPFQLILWENVAYLASDKDRLTAFQALKKEIGLRPVEIMSASIEHLTKICRIGGIHPETRASRIKECAQIALNEFDGNVLSVLKMSPARALKVLRQFPAIGEPGAEKILLFSHTHPILALESNGLRVLLRLGFGEEKKSYAASYKSAKAAVGEEDTSDCKFLIKAHQLLRRHGQELCKRSNPICQECPLRQACRYYLTTRIVV
jgi:endonuclease III